MTTRQKLNIICYHANLGVSIDYYRRDGESVPAALAQQRLWFLAQLDPTSPAYNEPLMLQSPEPLDAAALAAALTEIVRRHAAWRTVFLLTNGQVYQHIQPPAPFPLTVIDLSGQAETDEQGEPSAVSRESAALRRAVAEARRPFDLAAGPLVRALLIRLSEHDQRLFITAHHLVVDGLSYFQVFLPELHLLYNAFRKGQSPPLAGLPELPMQYADFADWQRRFLTEARLTPQLEFWREQLAEVQELELPTDFPRSAQPARDGARHEVQLSLRLSEALRELGRRYGVSLFTVILSAWKTLLYRYTGQSDVVVGSAVAGRRTPELEPLVGFFANNLVLRTQLDGSLTFGQLLARVHTVLQAARKHQDVPFERLVSHLNVPRALNRNPLFSTTCIVMPKVAPPASPPYWTASRFDIGVAKLDLYLELHQSQSGLAGHLEYRTDLFRPDTIARLAGHLQTLLHALVKNPDRPLAQLGLLTEQEQRQLRGFSGEAAPAAPAAEERTPLPQLFEQQVARTPDAVALVFGEAALTYRELNRRANQLAHCLRGLGVGPDALVGLLLERGPDMIIGILGIHKAGGAYVPLDPGYPAERLRFLLADSKPPLLLTHAHLRDTLPAHTARVLCLDTDFPQLASQPEENPPPLALASHLAYVIYTSGSTGAPKGVLIEHGCVSNLLRTRSELFACGPGSRVLQFFSFSFDASVLELAFTLTSGATLVQAPRAALLPGADLSRLLREQAITILHLTPSVLAALPVDELPALQTIAVGGEVCTSQLVARWAAGRRFCNGYGPTECTVLSTFSRCEALDAEQEPSIGRPIPGAEIHILDSALQPVPVGVPGELYIGGPGLARGYLNRPELTAERFIVNPLPEARSPRLYRTGDRARFRPDGCIEFLGRTDRQVKLRGFRIELGEIESLLLRHPEVAEAAVVLRTEPPGDPRLAAYVVPRQAEALELAAELAVRLTSYLKEQLPEPMVPPSFSVLARLPTSAVGKLERSALPSPALTAAATRPLYEAPAFEIERVIIAAWQEVLCCEGIGVRDNFFDLGGHSLRLAEVQSQLQAALLREVPMMDLFRYPTVRELAVHLSGSAAPALGAGTGGPLATPSRERALRQRSALNRPIISRRSPRHD